MPKMYPRLKITYSGPLVGATIYSYLNLDKILQIIENNPFLGLYYSSRFNQLRFFKGTKKKECENNRKQPSQPW